MLDKKTSYTSANALPIKIIQDTELMRSITEDKKILPRHIQVCPTNKCNLNCSFCSCSDVERKQSLSLSELVNILDIAKKEGTKGMTITGGGEPTLHPYINEFLQAAYNRNIRTGLVSNGLKIGNINKDAMNTLTWARVSFGDERFYNKHFKDQMYYAYLMGEQVDWAFSYVVGTNPNMDNINNIIKHANQYDMTHVRLVADLFSVKDVNLDEVKKKLTVDDSKVIYQGRKEYQRGAKECYISLLKPLIAPDGFVYPCCGVQYAINDTPNHFPEQMRMGHYKDLPNIIKEQKFFDGSVCDKCYYTDYNQILKALLSDINHKEFV